MEYCTDCGARLIHKYLKNEGIVPYCGSCQKYVFPIFSTACSMIVLNPKRDKILLIKQYGRNRYILVAGYINKGESAEHTVKREIKEEVGLEVAEITFNKSEYFRPSNTLMLNFCCVAESENFIRNSEVDQAKWVPIERADETIAQDSLAQKFLEAYLEKTL